MTRKQRRMSFVMLGLATLGIAAALVLNALDDSLAFFYSPTDLAEKQVPKDQRLRVGGLVKQGSWRKEADGLTHAFLITDMQKEVRVAYKGIMPDLFREGQGVIAEGRLDASGLFRADEVLAKHDENYMPPEVAESLKKAGVWEGAKPQEAQPK